MHSFATLILIPMTLLSALVAGDACVVGGPDKRVSFAEKCCYGVSGKWFSNYPVQGICVLKGSVKAQYDACVAVIAPDYDVVCIQCDETQDCGLDPTSK